MKMNAQCSLYNVHGLTCNIDCPKNTSVHFFPHPPMTVKMSLTSPCVHCPIADGTTQGCILSIEIITKCSTLQNLDTSFHKNCSQVARRYRFPVVFGVHAVITFPPTSEFEKRFLSTTTSTLSHRCSSV